MGTTRVAADRNQSAPRSAIVESAAGVMVATLALAAFVCVAAFVPRFAGDGNAASIDDLRACSILADHGARLGCYDEIANRPLPHPARGANAPATAFRPTPAQGYRQ